MSSSVNSPRSELDQFFQPNVGESDKAAMLRQRKENECQENTGSVGLNTKTKLGGLEAGKKKRSLLREMYLLKVRKFLINEKDERLCG